MNSIAVNKKRTGKIRKLVNLSIGDINSLYFLGRVGNVDNYLIAGL
jgi:hypothetical protein